MAVEETFMDFLKGRGIHRVPNSENQPLVAEFRQTSLAPAPAPEGSRDEDAANNLESDDDEDGDDENGDDENGDDENGDDEDGDDEDGDGVRAFNGQNQQSHVPDNNPIMSGETIPFGLDETEFIIPNLHHSDMESDLDDYFVPGWRQLIFGDVSVHISSRGRSFSDLSSFIGEQSDDNDWAYGSEDSDGVPTSEILASHPWFSNVGSNQQHNLDRQDDDEEIQTPAHLEPNSSAGAEVGEVDDYEVESGPPANSSGAEGREIEDDEVESEPPANSSDAEEEESEYESRSRVLDPRTRALRDGLMFLIRRSENSRNESTRNEISLVTQRSTEAARDQLDEDLYYRLRIAEFGSVTQGEGSHPLQDADALDSLSIASDFNEDDDYKYIQYRDNGDRRFSNNMSIVPSKNLIGLLENSDDELFPSKWDFADKEENKEETELGGKLSVWDSKLDMANSTSDWAYLTEEPLALKYTDGLQLKYTANSRLLGLPKFHKYKNNLTDIIRWNNEDFLVIAANSSLVISRLDPLKFVPERVCCLKFETKPTITNLADRMVSTWPYFPHLINFIKVLDSWIGTQCLAACIDDGSVLIWKVETFMSNIESFKSRVTGLSLDENNNLVEPFSLGNLPAFSLKINPDLRIKLTSSAWGLDSLSYVDDSGMSHNLLVTSDNSQKITIFYYDIWTGKFHQKESHQLLHNIPEVSFVDHYQLDNVHYVKVACSVISSELVIFKSHFVIYEGPFPKNECGEFSNNYYIDPVMETIESGFDVGGFDDELQQPIRNLDYDKFHFKRFELAEPHVKLRTYLSRDCWTVKPVDSKYFHEVSQLRRMCGDPYLEDSQEVRNILCESETLKLPADLRYNDYLGGAVNWQFFETPVASFGSGEDRMQTAKHAEVDDEYRRIHKGYQLQLRQQKFQGNHQVQFQTNRNKFLLVSTSQRVGMYRSDTLFCNAGTRTVFDVKVPHDDDSQFANRILISLIIPQLSCYIACTQQGLVSIFRLCRYKGVYGMRQEHVFPNAPVLTVEAGVSRTIVGVAARDISVSVARPRFVLYLTFSDGLVFAYTLCKSGIES